MINNLLLLQYYRSPLHIASGLGHTDVVKTLISHGDDVHAKDDVSKCFMS